LPEIYANALKQGVFRFRRFDGFCSAFLTNSKRIVDIIVLALGGIILLLPC